VPETVDGRVKVKVVYVVLESQYQAALSQAVKNINAKNTKVAFEIVGYLLEELRDETNYQAFKKDLETTNIFVGSLIFIEELAEKVSAPTPRAAKLMLCAMVPVAGSGFRPHARQQQQQEHLGSRRRPGTHPHGPWPCLAPP
jgi:magnesium chelatase subunit H